MRKAYRQLPFERKENPRGRLICSEPSLRVNPSTRGAMTPSQLQDICIGLADNTSVTKLDLDGNQFALGWDDAESGRALDPLVSLLEANKTIQTLDISNNGLSFAEEDGLLESMEKLICRSNLTSIVIGGNMDIDDVLMGKVGEWIAASGRRWKSVSVGSVDQDYNAAVEELRAAVRAATTSAETKAIGNFFKQRPAVAVAAHLQDERPVPPRDGISVRHHRGRSASPERVDSGRKAGAAVRERSRSRSPEPAAAPSSSRGALAMGLADAPSGATEQRCVRIENKERVACVTIVLFCFSC